MNTAAVPRPRHPFRARIRHIERANRAHAEDHDWKLFLLSFTAFFLCFYAMIA